MRLVLILISILITQNVCLSGQIIGRISGQITDTNTDQPIGYVNIFLANTMIGTISDSNGYYQIDDIPPGIFTLVFQHVGYQVKTYQLVIRRSEVFKKDVQLEPAILEGEAIEIVAPDPEKWQQYYKVFEQEFIGETDNAFECTILNPTVLNFEFNSEHNEVIATTDSLIRVQNLALGYNITIVLVHFRARMQGDWVEYLIHPKYQEISTPDVAMNQIWQEHRRLCFLGSRRHFFASMVNSTLDNEDFMVYAGSFGGLQIGAGTYITPQLLKPEKINDAPFFKFTFEESMKIDYKGRLPSPSSIIQLSDDYALIDSLGNLLTPLALTMYGTWADHRVADTLPFNYKP